jgi:hypothetical protein
MTSTFRHLETKGGFLEFYPTKAMFGPKPRKPVTITAGYGTLIVRPFSDVDENWLFFIVCHVSTDLGTGPGR